MAIKRGRDNPEGLTAREVIEDIANFPLSQDFEYDRFGEIKNGSSSWGPSWVAHRSKSMAREWLRLNPAKQKVEA